MRIHTYVLTVALCAAASSQAALGQSPQGQSNASATQSTSTKQSPITPQQTISSGTPGASKAAPKPPVLLTNDNIDDPTVKQTIHGTAQPNAQRDPKATAAQVSAAPKAQSNQQAATSASAAKPKLLLDPHKVLTNDDLRSLGRQGDVSVVGVDVDLNGIYDCDVNCYNEVREAAKVYPGSDLEWMRDLHSGIEKLKKNNDWRAVLVHLADIRSKFCTLAADEQAALARADNFDNVTEQQINIREQYNRQLNAANQNAVATYSRMTPLQAQYSSLVASFMSVQVSRIMQANCSGRNSNNYSADPDDPND